jgi:hypothetical protein
MTCSRASLTNTSYTKYNRLRLHCRAMNTWWDTAKSPFESGRGVLLPLSFVPAINFVIHPFAITRDEWRIFTKTKGLDLIHKSRDILNEHAPCKLWKLNRWFASLRFVRTYQNSTVASAEYLLRYSIFDNWTICNSIFPAHKVAGGLIADELTPLRWIL